MTKMAVEIDWYEQRDSLHQGMIFITRDGDKVQLDRTVPGDATKWYVLDWVNGWSTEDSTIEPGDLFELVQI